MVTFSKRSLQRKWYPSHLQPPLPQFLCAQAIWHPVFLSSSCRIFCRVEQVVCREYTHPCDRSCTDCKILEQVSFLLNFADSSCIFYAKGNLLLIAVNMYKHFYTSYLPHTRVPPSHVPYPADCFPLLLFNRSGVALGGACLSNSSGVSGPWQIKQFGTLVGGVTF